MWTEQKSGFLVAEASRDSGSGSHGVSSPATPCFLRVCFLGSHNTDAGTFLPETPRRRGPLKRLRCRRRAAYRWLRASGTPRSRQSQPSSSTPKLSWKENGIGFVFGCLAKPGHRWDNDFYKQHFDERRGEGVICNTHKGCINTRMPAAGTN